MVVICILHVIQSHMFSTCSNSRDKIRSVVCNGKKNILI